MDNLVAGEQQAAALIPCHELVPEVMAFVIEAYADKLDTKSLCSLLQVSNACRTAMQGSRGNHSISIQPNNPAVSGLKAWLPKWAGLVAELRLVAPERVWSGGSSYITFRRPAVSELIITDLMSAIKQHTASAAATSVQNSRRAAPHLSAGSSSHMEAPSAPAADGSKAAPIGISLLLKSFSIGVPVLPTALEALPAASLTRLELLNGVSWSEHALPQALRQLSNLSHLRFTHEWDREPGMPGALCQALPSLTRLTGLEIGPMVTADANNCLPTSLVDLKLQFCTIAVPQPKAPKLAASARADSGAGAADSAHDSSADNDDSSDGMWSNWEVEEEEWEEVTAEQHKAARLLDLTSLPLLQSCQVMRIHPWLYLQNGDENHEYTDLVTLRLAAPQLTRLLLVNHFKDVEGLQDCTKLQDLALAGCAVKLPRLAQLVTGFPSLRIFFYHGDEVVEGGMCCMCLGRPVLWASVEEQQQLASAISGATQLTSLYIHGLSERGYVKVGVTGQVTLDEGGPSRVTDGEYKGWGGKVCSLSGLQQLVLDAPMPDADILQLTQLTALTLFGVTENENFSVCDSIRNEVLSQMPRLHFNPKIDVTLW